MNMMKDWIKDEMEELLQFLEKQTNEYLEGFYASDSGLNPYHFFDDYTRHYNFDIGNQSSHRAFYFKHLPF